MTLGSQEHIDIMAMFEKEAPKAFYGRFDREDKSMWSMGRIYQDGHINDLFLAYRRGYALARATYMNA